MEKLARLNRKESSPNSPNTDQYQAREFSLFYNEYDMLEIRGCCTPGVSAETPQQDELQNTFLQNRAHALTEHFSSNPAAKFQPLASDDKYQVYIQGLLFVRT